MAQRNWLGTENNPEEDPAVFLERVFNKLQAVYCCGQLEKGKEGTAHIQYFVNVKQPVRVSALKKVAPRSHFEVVKINNGAHNYCMKEDTRVEGPWEFGVKPVQRNNKTDWEEVKKNAQEGQLDKIPADIYVKNYFQLRAIAKDHLKPSQREEPRQCYWLYGPTGSGKSRFVREEYPEHYPKMCNKWWDGYQSHKVVLIDDFDKKHDVLGHHLKIWADPYGHFIGESKGGAITPSYDILYVTSNYHPREIWEDS
jgi:hypothetical protein